MRIAADGIGIRRADEAAISPAAHQQHAVVVTSRHREIELAVAIEIPRGNRIQGRADAVVGGHGKGTRPGSGQQRHAAGAVAPKNGKIQVAVAVEIAQGEL